MKKKRNILIKVLKKDFLLLILVPVAVFILIFTFYLFNYIQDKEEIEQKMMLSLVECQVQNIFENNRFLLNELNTTINNNLIRSEDINYYFEDITNRYEMVDSIRIVNKDGNIIHAPVSQEDIIGFSVSYQDYYISAIESDGDFISKVFISGETSKPTAAVTLKGQDEELIICYYSLNQLQKNLDKLPRNKLHNIAIVNSKGNIIAHSDFTKVIGRENETKYDKLRTDGNYILDYNNKKLLVSSLNLPDFGITIIIYKALFESYNILGKFIFFSLICAALIMIISGILAHIKTKPIVNTIVSLTNQTGRISQGDYEIDIEDSNIYELDELKDNFNSMAKIIKEAFDGLSESQMELEMLNEDLYIQNEEIKKNEEQISQIINNIYDGIIVLDSKFNIVWINNIVLDLFKIERKQIKSGTKCYELFYSHSSKCFRCDMEVVKLSKERISNVFKKDDKVIEETYIPSFNDNGELNGVIKTFRDITDKVALETRLNKAAKMETIGRLTGGIAHDFNNILQVIIGYSDLIIMQMKGTKEYDKILPKVEIIYETSVKAEKLIKKLMTFSKIDQTSPKNININEIIEETIPMLSSIMANDIELILTLDDSISNIFADPTQIEQIIMNLCINSKDSIEGKGRIEIITYQTQGKNNYIVLKVIDNGSGISPKIKDKIFDPFFTTKEIGKGTGLGLSIVQGIVDKLKGFIELETEIGKGTSFSIYFPISDNNIMYSPNKKFTNKVRDLKGLNILLAEDDDSVRNIASIILKNEGIRLIEAIDGQDALKKYVNNKDNIDIIILDVMMPRKNGIEVYKEIKKINENIKVIFTTGYSDDYLKEDYNLFLEGKILEKPYKNEELIRAVISTLEDN